MDDSKPKATIAEAAERTPASRLRRLTSSLRRNWPLGVIVVAFLAYSGEFIRQTSFVIDGVRYFALFDDSMVSMTYARNLARGFGLVWNAGGERIEGFSNPLWTCYMALLHLLPISMPKISLVVQLTGALLLVLTLALVKDLAERILPGDRVAVWCAVILSAFYYPLLNWSLHGTEVSALVLITVASAWMAVRGLEQGQFPRALYVLLGIGTLVRIDAAVPMLAILGFMFVFDERHRKDHAVWGLGALAVFLGGQTLLRKAYYGDWLPNTYYLKMSGYPALLRMRRGWSVFVDFANSLKAPLALVSLLALIRQGDRKRWLLAAVFLAECAYSIYVGGDAWEERGGANRFIATAMPIFMILYMAGWHEVRLLVEALVSRIAARLKRPALAQRWVLSVVRWAGAGALGLTLVISLLYFNRLNDAGSLLIALTHPKEGRLSYALLLKRPIFAPGSERYTMDAMVLRKVTTPAARIAVVAAGNTPYFSERYSIDLLGKTDRKIAHEPARILPGVENALMFRPGHIKWDYAYSIGELAPDVVTEAFRDAYDEARPYLVDYESIVINGHPMYFRRGSPHVHWSALDAYR